MGFRAVLKVVGLSSDRCVDDVTTTFFVFEDSAVKFDEPGIGLKVVGHQRSLKLFGVENMKPFGTCNVGAGKSSSSDDDVSTLPVRFVVF